MARARSTFIPGFGGAELATALLAASFLIVLGTRGRRRGL